MADFEISTSALQAALPATIRCVVEVWTSNVRILGSVSSKCFIIHAGLRKLGFHSTSELILYAVRNHIIQVA